MVQSVRVVAVRCATDTLLPLNHVILIFDFLRCQQASAVSQRETGGERENKITRRFEPDLVQYAIDLLVGLHSWSSDIES